MQVKISARHGHLGEEAQALIREKAEKLLHYFERLTMIEVVVDLQKSHGDHQCQAELRVQAEHKHDFVAHESGPDTLSAVDRAVSVVETQLRRYKEKVQDHRRNPSHGGEGGIKP
ncbi:MAG: ribosome-associated translation inhibitor RaiA [Gemmataceae bacterium]|nr:ribosome-associated translation inhibitor RaiA [Gemmataceae bacterium]